MTVAVREQQAAKRNTLPRRPQSGRSQALHQIRYRL
jgi:hypothetical protein